MLLCSGNGFKVTEVKLLSHCIEVENGVGDEMIHLLRAIMKTFSFAGINSNLQKLWIAYHLSK
jgi:hypothetical protein